MSKREKLERYECGDCEYCNYESGTLIDELILAVDPEFDFTEMDPDGEMHKDIKKVLRKHFGKWKELLKK